MMFFLEMNNRIKNCSPSPLKKTEPLLVPFKLNAAGKDYKSR